MRESDEAERAVRKLHRSSLHVHSIVVELAKERDKVLQAYYKERTAWNKLNPNDKVQSVSLSELFDD